MDPVHIAPLVSAPTNLLNPHDASGNSSECTLATPALFGGNSKPLDRTFNLSLPLTAVTTMTDRQPDSEDWERTTGFPPSPPSPPSPDDTVAGSPRGSLTFDSATAESDCTTSRTSTVKREVECGEAPSPSLAFAGLSDSHPLQLGVLPGVSRPPQTEVEVGFSEAHLAASGGSLGASAAMGTGKPSRRFDPASLEPAGAQDSNSGDTSSPSTSNGTIGSVSAGTSQTQSMAPQIDATHEVRPEGGPGDGPISTASPLPKPTVPSISSPNGNESKVEACTQADPAGIHRAPNTTNLKNAQTHGRGNGWTGYHKPRKTELLKRHPELAELFGAHPLSVALTLCTEVAFFALALTFGWIQSPVLTLLGACILGNICHGLFRAFFHDAMHRTLSDNRFVNDGLAFLTIAINPWADVEGQAAAFENHISKHHLQTGKGVGPDPFESLYETTIGGVHFFDFLMLSPSKRVLLQAWEVLLTARRLIESRATTLRLAALLLDRSPEALQPASLARRRRCVTAVAQLVILAAYVALSFCLGGLAGVLHTLAFSFIASATNQSCCFFTASSFFAATNHFLVDDNQPTFDIVSPMYNFLSAGSGYHMEHRELPTVPVWLTHRIRKIAPEMYSNTVTMSISDRLYNVFLRKYTQEELERQRQFLQEMGRGERVFDLNIDDSHDGNGSASSAEHVPASPVEHAPASSAEHVPTFSVEHVPASVVDHAPASPGVCTSRMAQTAVQ